MIMSSLFQLSRRTVVGNSRRTMVARRLMMMASQQQQQQQQRPILLGTMTPSMTSISSHHHFFLSSRQAFSSSSSSSFFSKKKKKDDKHHHHEDHWNKDQVNSFVGHSFPDFIEGWNRDTFRHVGYGLGVTTTALLGTSMFLQTATTTTYSSMIFVPTATVIVGTITTFYWIVGLRDMKQTTHAIRRNYPVLGNMRYILETIRPEIRQYLVESDSDGAPFDRHHRSLIYQRSKNVRDTIPFGTRRNVYSTHYEWACHSFWPKTITEEDAKRCMVGCADYGTTQPYSASILNISAMSYGAISDHAILALNMGAKVGGFYHNTGEGGVSKFHKQGGGDLVWNIGTGYFGCGSNYTTNTNASTTTTDNTNNKSKESKNNKRIFEPLQFQETIQECKGQIKMVELKLSQGAKPGSGGLLPMSKITSEIALARKLDYPPQQDCNSPPSHSAFTNAHELVEFIVQLRELSHGLPIGIKLCVGQPRDVAQLCQAMVELKNGPDFITVDGAEGGTGAAPPELSNSVGLPLEEGLVLVRNMLTGANLHVKTRLIASGKLSSGFSLIKTVALGADVTCAARAFMMSLGCIQALKCHTNKCPTGIATQDSELMYGLDPQDKTHRVYHYHRKTVQTAAKIAGIMGYERLGDVTPNDIMRRIQSNQVRTLAEHFPPVEPGCLLDGSGPSRLQQAWDECNSPTTTTTATTSHQRWIY